MGLIRDKKRPKKAKIFGTISHNDTNQSTYSSSRGVTLNASGICAYRSRLANSICQKDLEELKRQEEALFSGSQGMESNDWQDCMSDSGDVMDINEVLDGDLALESSHEGGKFLAIVEEYLGQQRRKRIDHRTRRDRTERHNAAFQWDHASMVDAYLSWYASLGEEKFSNDSPQLSESTPPEQGTYPVIAIDVFARFEKKIFLREGDTSLAASFLKHGLVPCAPYTPSFGITIRVLELYRVVSLRCPQTSIQSFVKALCDLQDIPFRSTFAQHFSICLDVYLSIQRTADLQVRTALGRGSPNWRLQNACPACTYKLKNEPKLEFDMLITMDGNDSLKRIEKRQQVLGNDDEDPILGESSELPDSRSVSSDYYLSRTTVDRWDKGVISQLNDDGYQPYIPSSEEEENHCEDRWKNMANELTSKMWGIFDETGIFLSLCRHGFVLVVADMVRSGKQAKYPLAVVEKLLNVFGSNIGGGYDIGCKFGSTLNSSPLGTKAKALNYRSLVGSFHGHAHNRRCQLKHLATYVKGLGIEDLEGCERFFSKSNGLASSVRHASVFHRRQKIEGYLRHMDECETYHTLSTFLVNNYKQALQILNTHLALERQMKDQGITDPSIFLTWLEEEKAYLQGLQREPIQETMAMEYLKSLIELESCIEARLAAHNIWIQASPAHATNGHLVSENARKIETARRNTLERELKYLEIVQGLELKLGISERWRRGDPKWVETEQMLIQRKYQRCLDTLEGLIVSRMFELSKMNLSQTGYKMRKHIGNALKARSKAICTALVNYNAAARSLTPPRAELSWDNVVEYAFLADFDLLSDTRQDIRDLPWARPAARTLRDQYFKIDHAKEEISRLNVEIARFATYIHDEEQFLLEKEAELLTTHPLLSVQVKHRRLRLMKINDIHIQRLMKLSRHSGFTGSIRPGIPFSVEDNGDGHSLLNHSVLETSPEREFDNSGDESELSDAEVEAEVEAFAALEIAGGLDSNEVD